MSRQCYLVLDLFLLELQYLGWTENPMPKTLKTAISTQNLILGSASYLQAADAAVSCNIYLTHSSESG